MVNLYAYRSTDPKALSRVEHQVGNPRNYDAWIEEFGYASVVVAAWGATTEIGWTAKQLLKRLASNKHIPIYCLGKTKDGSPKHPVRLAAETPLEIYMEATP